MTHTAVHWLLGLLFVLTSAMESDPQDAPAEHVYAQDDQWLEEPMFYDIEISERFGEQNWLAVSGTPHPLGVYKFQHLSHGRSPVFKGPKYTMWRGDTERSGRNRSFNDKDTWYWAPNSIVESRLREGGTVRLPSCATLEESQYDGKSIYRWIGDNVAEPTQEGLPGRMWNHYTRLDDRRYDHDERRTWKGFFLNNVVVKVRKLTAEEKQRVQKQIEDSERDAARDKERVAEKAQDEGNVCQTCYENPPETVIMTCRHLTQCHDCIQTLLKRAEEDEQTAKCPNCRKPFERENTLRVFGGSGH